MWISTRAEYCFRAMLDLALNYGQGPIKSREIAARQNIPDLYLDQLLTTMRKGGLILSTRGPQGGHALARPPEVVSLADVLLALEGTLTPVACLGAEDENCPHNPACVIREVWTEVDAEIQRVLRDATLDKLARQHRERAYRLSYQI